MAFAICISAVSVNAQDVITKKNGDEIQAKITEVGQNEIKYKRFDNPDGPVYTIGKSDVFMVKYENGTKDVFKEDPAAQSNVSKSNDNREFWNTNLWTNKTPAGIGFFIDPAGFGFYGFRFGAEVRIRRFDVSIAGRTGGGLITYVTHENQQGLPDEIVESYGVSFNPKFLFPNSTCFAGYVGAIADYGRLEFRRNTVKKTVREDVIMSGVGGGIKIRTKSGFYTNIGSYFGVYYAPTEEYKYDDERYFKTDYSGFLEFFGMAEVALGFEIGIRKK